jgi:hypothetical protein
MQELDQSPTDAFIRDIDLMARAAYTWVRQQTFEQRFIGLPVSAAQELDLAAGFLAGLTARLQLDKSELIQLAYAYALMTGERSGAIRTAKNLIDRETAAFASCSAYLLGLKSARELFFESANGIPANTSYGIKVSSSVN